METLRAQILPLLGGAVRFFLDGYLFEDGQGKLHGGPSTSPENSYALPHAAGGSSKQSKPYHYATLLPAIDVAVVATVFGAYVEGAAMLADGAGTTDCEIVEVRGLAERAVNALMRMPNAAMPRVGLDGAWLWVVGLVGIGR